MGGRVLLLPRASLAAPVPGSRQALLPRGEGIPHGRFRGGGPGARPSHERARRRDPRSTYARARASPHRGGAVRPRLDAHSRTLPREVLHMGLDGPRHRPRHHRPRRFEFAKYMESYDFRQLKEPSISPASCGSLRTRPARIERNSSCPPHRDRRLPHDSSVVRPPSRNRVMGGLCTTTAAHAFASASPSATEPPEMGRHRRRLPGHGYARTITRSISSCWPTHGPIRAEHVRTRSQTLATPPAVDSPMNPDAASDNSPSRPSWPYPAYRLHAPRTFWRRAAAPLPGMAESGLAPLGCPEFGRSILAGPDGWGGRSSRVPGGMNRQSRRFRHALA